MRGEEERSGRLSLHVVARHFADSGPIIPLTCRILSDSQHPSPFWRRWLAVVEATVEEQRMHSRRR